VRDDERHCRPIAREFLNHCERHALRLICDGLLLRPAVAAIRARSSSSSASGISIANGRIAVAPADSDIAVSSHRCTGCPDGQPPRPSGTSVAICCVDTVHTARQSVVGGRACSHPPMDSQCGQSWAGHAGMPTALWATSPWSWPSRGAGPARAAHGRVMSSLAKTLCRWYFTVRVLMDNRRPISGFDVGSPSGCWGTDVWRRPSQRRDASRPKGPAAPTRRQVPPEPPLSAGRLGTARAPAGRPGRSAWRALAAPVA
jgi:hypothetical protein